MGLSPPPKPGQPSERPSPHYWTSSSWWFHWPWPLLACARCDTPSYTSKNFLHSVCNSLARSWSCTWSACRFSSSRIRRSRGSLISPGGWSLPWWCWLGFGGRCRVSSLIAGSCWRKSPIGPLFGRGWSCVSCIRANTFYRWLSSAFWSPSHHFPRAARPLPLYWSSNWPIPAWLHPHTWSLPSVPQHNLASFPIYSERPSSRRFTQSRRGSSAAWIA